MPSVFYSWQSDLDEREHRKLQAEALRGACAVLGAAIGAEFQDFASERTGSPTLHAALADSISGSAAFVGDATLTGTRPGPKGTTRPSPNPNVCIELGIALDALGAEGVVLVMNSASGAPEGRPSDVGAFVPCVYNLPVGAPDELLAQRTAELQANLAAELDRSIRAHFFRDFTPEVLPTVTRLVEWFVGAESTEHGGFFKLVSEAELASRLKLDPAAVRAAIDELLGVFLVDERAQLGGRGRLRATRDLLLQFDPLFLCWNPREDARRIAAKLVELDRGATTEELATALGWAPRRLNPAVWSLKQLGLIQVSNTLTGGSPFWTFQVLPADGLRQFAQLGRIPGFS